MKPTNEHEIIRLIQKNEKEKKIYMYNNNNKKKALFFFHWN